MKTTKLYIIGAMIFCTTMFGCSDFLDEKPDNIFTDEQVFTDLNMINSVVANYYGRVNWGPSFDDIDGFAHTDEAAFSSGGIREYRTFDENGDKYKDNPDRFRWRIYREGYELIRDINIFLRGLQSETAKNNIDLTENMKKELEGQVRFLRAWTYFNMAKAVGGVPIVNDEIFGYETGTNVLDLQIARSTEAATYDYIIAECTEASKLLENTKANTISGNIGAAKANKWVPLALKARAAVYAGSIAKYTVATELRLPNGEVGIPNGDANKYYTIAYDAANEIITGGPYSLYKLNTLDLGRNFYEALSNKEGNPEVMWAMDYIAPGKTHGFTNDNVAYSLKGDVDANKITPILNIVEAFEYTNDRNGKLKISTASDDYIFYDNLEELFANKDARLYGTIITPGSYFRSTYVSYQAGQKYLKDGKWTSRVGDAGSVDPTYGLITDQNGPVSNDKEYLNKTGFNIRKFMDENKDAATRGRGSDIWFVRFRYAEILLIAAESSLELGKPQTDVCGYINQVRERGGIQNLTTVTIDDIIQENRVEFVYENHRFWDLKRWRKSHILWNNDTESDTSMFYSLFPYKVNEPNSIQHGKWVFEKVKTYTTRYPRYFQMKNYYAFFEQDWLSKNPKLVKNPYQ